MKIRSIRIVHFLALIPLAWVFFVAMPTQGIAQGVQPNETETPQEEIRAIWVTAPSTPLVDPRAADAMIDEIVAAGFNTLIIQVRAFDDAYYESLMVPRASSLSSAYPDPLGHILGKIRERASGSDGKPPIRVVAALEVLRAHSMTIRTRPTADSVLAKNPDWATLNFANKAVDADQCLTLEPGLKAVRLYLAAVVTDLVGRYEIDGVYFDGLRYPGEESQWGYHPQVLQDFRRLNPDVTERPAPTDPRWVRYRQDVLGSLAVELAQVARQSRPGCQVFLGAETPGYAPATLEEWASGPIAFGMQQDWLKWGQTGVADWVCLKNRRPAGAPVGQFESWLALITRAGFRSRVCVKIEGGRNFNTTILSQIRSVQTAHLGGIALHDYVNPTAESRTQLMGHLGRVVFSQPRYVTSAVNLEYSPPTTPTPAPQATPTTPTLTAAVVEEEMSEGEGGVSTEEGAPEADYYFQPESSSRTEEVADEPSPTPAPTVVPPTPTPLPLPMENFRLRNGMTFRGRVVVQVEGRVTILTEDGTQLIIPRGQIVSPTLD